MTRSVHVLNFFALLFLLTLAPVKSFAGGVFTQEQLDSLCAVQKEMPDDVKKLEVLETIVRHHKNLDTIGKYVLIELRLAEKLGNTVYAASAAGVAGWLKYQKGRYVESAKYYKKAVIYYGKNGDKAGRANAVMGLGNILFRMNKYEAGLENAMSSLKDFAELGDTSMVCSVYRALGNSCYEYQMYKTSYAYFGKALELDLKTGNSRSIGRDYFSIGRCVNNMEGKTLEGIMRAKEYFKKAEVYSGETGDFMFLVYENFMLSFLYAEMSLRTEDWNYADSSSICYEKCKDYIEEIDFKEFEPNLAIVAAVRHVLGGNYLQAESVLKNYAATKKTSNSQRRLFFRAYNIYFRYTKNYKDWFRYLEEDALMKRRYYISEFGVKLELVNTQFDRELFIRQYDSLLTRNDLKFKQSQADYEARRKIWVQGISCVLIMIAVLTFFSLKNRRKNVLLIRQKEEISLANAELDILNQEAEAQRQELETQTAEITSRRNTLAFVNGKILRNMEMAGRLQQSIVPSKEFMQGLFGKIFILWKPLDIVSGDFYWAKKIADVKIVAVADCTGHGVPGACLSVWGIAMLNSIVARINPDTVSAAEMLEMLRTRIAETLSKGISDDDEVHDGMDMALCIIDTKKKKLSYAGAYRPLWIMKDGEFSELKADRMPVAIDHDHTDRFSAQERELDGTETLYMFSDGITDQFGMKPNGKLAKFQTSRLRELLKEISGESLETQKLKIEQAIRNWAGDQPQTDDVLVIGISETV